MWILRRTDSPCQRCRYRSQRIVPGRPGNWLCILFPHPYSVYTFKYSSRQPWEDSTCRFTNTEWHLREGVLFSLWCWNRRVTQRKNAQRTQRERFPRYVVCLQELSAQTLCVLWASAVKFGGAFRYHNPPRIPGSETVRVNREEIPHFALHVLNDAPKCKSECESECGSESEPVSCR